jgi:hypothetical protein
MKKINYKEIAESYEAIIKNQKDVIAESARRNRLLTSLADSFLDDVIREKNEQKKDRIIFSIYLVVSLILIIYFV